MDSSFGVPRFVRHTRTGRDHGSADWLRAHGSGVRWGKSWFWPVVLRPSGGWDLQGGPPGVAVKYTLRRIAAVSASIDDPMDGCGRLVHRLPENTDSPLVSWPRPPGTI